MSSVNGEEWSVNQYMNGKNENEERKELSCEPLRRRGGGGGNEFRTQKGSRNRNRERGGVTV